VVIVTTEMLTSCGLLNMQHLTGKVHDVGKPLLNAVGEEVHQGLSAVVRLGVDQLTQTHRLTTQHQPYTE